MNTKYILGALSIVFLTLSVFKMIRGQGPSHPQTRTWLMVGAIFGVVSIWLFSRG